MIYCYYNKMKCKICQEICNNSIFTNELCQYCNDKYYWCEICDNYSKSTFCFCFTHNQSIFNNKIFILMFALICLFIIYKYIL